MIIAARQHQQMLACVVLSFEIKNFYLISNFGCQSSLPFRNYFIHVRRRVKHIMFQSMKLITYIRIQQTVFRSSGALKSPRTTEKFHISTAATPNINYYTSQHMYDIRVHRTRIAEEAYSWTEQNDDHETVIFCSFFLFCVPRRIYVYFYAENYYDLLIPRLIFPLMGQKLRLYFNTQHPMPVFNVCIRLSVDASDVNV